MPTIKTIGPYRFFFYAGDRKEPAHIHVKRDAAQAKFWLQPVRLQKNKGFSGIELRQIERIVKTNEDDFYVEWIKFFA
jgi:hypothetical protein